MRACKLILAFLVILPACRVTDPILVTPSFESTGLAEVNPADIAILPLEDGTADQAATRHLRHMRRALAVALTQRRYSPLNTVKVDEKLPGNAVADGGTVMAPAVLKSLAGRCAEDGMLAVRIDRWDESRLMQDYRVQFQLHAALVAAKDGSVLWSGHLVGDVKAGGAAAAPLDPEARAQSCATIAMEQLIWNLPMRQP